MGGTGQVLGREEGRQRAHSTQTVALPQLKGETKKKKSQTKVEKTPFSMLGAHPFLSALSPPPAFSSFLR